MSPVEAARGGLEGRPLVPGAAEGRLLYAAEPMSFWGGYDPETGDLIDRRHELAGENAAGRVLAIPATRGSSTTTAVLLEAIRNGTAPAAIITEGPDAFLALASIVAEELYSRPIPIVALEPRDYRALASAERVRVTRTGRVEMLGDLETDGSRGVPASRRES